MKRFTKIRRLVKVELTPQEFTICMTAVEEAMRRMGTRDPHTQLELIGGFFKDDEKGMAFEARMQCMLEMRRSPELPSSRRECLAELV